MIVRADTIGLAWDKDSPNLKAAMLQDMMKIKDGFPDAQIELQPPEGWNDLTMIEGLAGYVELPIVKGREPTTWCVYVVDEEVALPDYAEEIIRKPLTMPVSRGIPLVPNEEKYPTLERQSDMRVVPPGVSLDLNKMPPRQNKDQPYQIPQNLSLARLSEFR